MALKINLGTARKLGTANYGSISASCAVEFEADPGLLHDDPEGFRDRVAQAYAACRTAVEQELARQQANGTAGTVENGSANGHSHPRNNGTATNGNGHSPSNGNGHTTGNGNGHTGGNGNGGHQASEKQMTYLRQLAAQVKGLGVRRLDGLAQKMFGKPITGLTSIEASGIIDNLKAAKAGEIDIESILNGEAS